MVIRFIKKYEIINIVLGIICIVFQDHVYKEFSLLFGLFLLYNGFRRSYSAWKAGEAFDGKTLSFETGLLVCCVAVGILILRDEALIVAGMFWGIGGLEKCGKYLNVVLYRYKVTKKIPIRHLLSFLVESLIEIRLGIFKK